MPKQKSKISIQEYYEKFHEDNRLSSGLGPLEFERTKIILKRFLPPSPATILDVGGGTGPYSCWLAKMGYAVHLIEPSPRLIEQARQASKRQSDAPLASTMIGDARSLNFPDQSADAILLFGPLYHLLEGKNRNLALKEAYRVLKDNGILFAAAISRFASAIDGFLQEFIKDPIFTDIIKQDLIDGQHRNPTENIIYFTDAYFHRPSELRQEIEDAGFKCIQLFPVEGIVALVTNFDEMWRDGAKRNYLLEMIELTEKEESILGVSPHLLSVAAKKRSKAPFQRFKAF